MNTVSLAFSYLKLNRKTTLCAFVFIAIGVFIICSAIHAYSEFTKFLYRSKGSAHLIITSNAVSSKEAFEKAILHKGKIAKQVSYKKVLDLLLAQKQGLIKSVIPFTLSGTYKDSPIIATNLHYITGLTNFRVSKNRFPDKTDEALIGYSVARKNNLESSDKIIDENKEYLVTGVLDKNNNSIDNLVLINTDGLFFLNGKKGSDSSNKQMVDAVLVRYANREAQEILPGFIDQQPGLSATIPIDEIANILSRLNVQRDYIIVAGALITLTGLLFCYLHFRYLVKEKSSDFETMLLLGASRYKIYKMIGIQQGSIIVAAASVGFAFCHLAAALIPVFT